jgi:hypothetical protein
MTSNQSGENEPQFSAGRTLLSELSLVSNIQHLHRRQSRRRQSRLKEPPELARSSQLRLDRAFLPHFLAAL